jgi:hypothetical protein
VKSESVGGAGAGRGFCPIWRAGTAAQMKIYAPGMVEKTAVFLFPHVEGWIDWDSNPIIVRLHGMIADTRTQNDKTDGRTFSLRKVFFSTIQRTPKKRLQTILSPIPVAARSQA